MKISSRFDYGLSCILRVAEKYGSRKPVAVSFISKREKIASDYIEQLMIRMKRAGLVKSIRGPAGGYILTRPPEKISIREVAEAIEMEILELICFRKKGRGRKCVHFKDCKIMGLWMKLKKEIESFFESHNLKNLVLLRRKEKSW